MMNKFPIALLVIVLNFSPTGLFAQRAADHEKKFQKIEKVLQSAIDDENVVGHSVLAYHDGEVIYYNEWGQRDLKNQLPIERDTIFRIYSMSKPITSVAVMQLVEAEKIDLDEPISTYLPELGDLKVLERGKEVRADREMTTRDLLRHTSGLTYGFFGDTEVDQAYRRNGVLLTDRNIEDTVSKLSKIPLLHQPGQRFHYSVSTDVLGRLIEVVSEERFDDYLQEHIFEPLGMEDTFFTVPRNKRDRFAELYEGRQGNLRRKNALASYRFLNANDFDSGGGGLCSTMDDYLVFCKMLLAGGTLNDHQILQKESIDEMFKNQLEEVTQNSRRFQFGLGFRVFPEGDFGWGGAAGTRFWVNPEKQLVILYMVQMNPYGRRDWGNRFRKAVYDSLDQ